MGPDCIVCIVTQYRPDGVSLNTSEGKLFHTVQNGPGAHPASCTLGSGSLTWVGQPVQGTDCPPTPSAEVRERVGL